MGVDLWTSTAFLDEVTAWAAAHARAAGSPLSGEREQPHARPWSSALRFGTDDGPLWLKVNGPGTTHEPALIELAARVVPDLVPELVATDSSRGWMLMRDAGPVLRTVAEPDALWDRWTALLQQYAAAQLSLAGHHELLLGTGVEDLAPERMPDRLEQLIATLDATPVDQGGLAAAETDQLESVLPRYRSWCAELADSGVPVSVNHDDLHSANVCVRPSGMRVIDWGDASAMHPFGTMLVTLDSIARHAGTTVADPRVQRVRDAYLDVFGNHGDRATRARWCDVARWTGCLSRALTYARALEGEPVATHAEHDWPVRGWLLELLER